MYFLIYTFTVRYNLYCIFDVLKPNSVHMGTRVLSVCHRHVQDYAVSICRLKSLSF